MVKAEMGKFMTVVADYMVHVAKFVYQSENSCWVFVRANPLVSTARVRIRAEEEQIRVTISVDGSSVLRQFLISTRGLDEGLVVEIFNFELSYLYDLMDAVARFEGSTAYSNYPTKAPVVPKFRGPESGAGLGDF